MQMAEFKSICPVAVQRVRAIGGLEAQREEPATFLPGKPQEEISPLTPRSKGKTWDQGNGSDSKVLAMWTQRTEFGLPAPT